MKKCFSILILIILFSGCTPTKYIKPPELDQLLDSTSIEDHFIFINSDGLLIDPKTDDPHVDSKSYIDKILKKFDKIKKEYPSLKLTIFVHGGLNKLSTSFERANNTYKHMLAQEPGKKQYPIFISWRSWIDSNYFDHLVFLRKGEKMNFLGPGLITFPFILLEDFTRSFSRLPAAIFNMFISQNLLYMYLFDTTEESAASINLKRMKEEGQFLIHGKDSRYELSTSEFLTLINPVKIALAPLADGLGKGSWNSMLRRTDLILRSHDAFMGKNNSKTAVSYFFSEWEKEKKYKDVEITLIGHSMGTIVVNNILNKFSTLNYKNVVYMGAASKTKDIGDYIVPWLERNRDNNVAFYNLTLSPYADICEKKYLGSIPRGSLLVWIDTFLADVNSFQDRTAGFWFNIVRSADVIFPSDNDIRSKVHLTKFCIKDTCPQNHGDFDDYNFWDESFWKADIKNIYKITK